MKTRSPTFIALVLLCTPSHRYDALRAGLMQWARYLATGDRDLAVRLLLYDAAKLLLTDAIRQEAGRGQLFDLLVVARDELGVRPVYEPELLPCCHPASSWTGSACGDCVSAARLRRE